MYRLPVFSKPGLLRQVQQERYEPCEVRQLLPAVDEKPEATC